MFVQQLVMHLIMVTLILDSVYHVMLLVWIVKDRVLMSVLNVVLDISWKGENV